MASTAEIPTFKHDALPDASTYIRLLEVVSVDPTRDVSVRCRLTTWLKESSPAYTAISYTWGDPRQVTDILVNGDRMTVRRNCEDVLRQQCWAKGGHFWIDAICINQADNDEKSFQVAKMGEVYRDARQTLACVGQHADDSEFLFETLHEHRRGYEKHERYCFDFKDRVDYLARILGDEPPLARLEEAFGKFFNRSYFRRVWIYQELFFGHDIHVCCADDEPVKFLFLWALYAAYQNRLDSPSQQERYLRYRPMYQWPHFHLTEILGLIETATMEKQPESFRTMIYSVEKLGCADPRDRVFGTLIMIDWEGETPIRPDYSMDPLDLTVELMRRLGMARETLLSALEATIRIAELMRLPGKSSRRLTDEILARRSRENMVPCLGTQIIGRAPALKPIIFWGYRISSHNAGWQVLSGLSEDLVGEGSALRHKNSTDPTSLIHPSKIRKWSKGTVWKAFKTDLLLPAEALPQDWLLIPHKTKTQVGMTFIALVVRDGSGGHLHIVGKAIFIASHERQWKALELKGRKFGLYLDHGDAIVLAHSCNWSDWYGFFPDRNVNEFEVDGYFETKLCGERSRTCVERMDWVEDQKLCERNG